MKIKRFSIFVPGTCGELIQGKTQDKDFLVTAPINLFSITTLAKIDSGTELRGIGWKTQKAIEIFSKKYGIKLENLSLTLTSNIPKGKGMASSSADISSILYALGRYYEVSLSPSDIAEIAIQIEPTDGVMFPGVVIFDYLKGSFWEYIGKPLPLRVLIVDLGGEIDTLNFERSLPDEDFSSYLLKNLKKAFKERDVNLFGKIITEGTLGLSKKKCGDLINKALELGAVGVNSAHSGTVCGIYTPYSKVNDVDRIRELFPSLSFLGWYDFIGGGYLFEI